jgi:TonB family protein
MEPITFCAECGHKVRPGTQFCSQCGKELLAAIEAEVQEPVKPWRNRPIVLAGAIGFAILLVGALYSSLNPTREETNANRPQGEQQAGSGLAAVGRVLGDLTQHVGGDRTSLARVQARNVITNDLSFSSVKQITLLEPTARTLEAAAREGLFATDGFNFSLTQEGRQFFVVEGGVVSGWLVGLGVIVTLPAPAKREVIEVTGITAEGTDQRRVVFTWKYTGLSDVVVRYTGQGPGAHDGVALLRLYDDGWRLENVVQLKETGRVPLRADANRIRRTEETARETADVREEAERARKEVELARAERERVAKTPTRTIASYPFVRRDKWNGRLRITTTIVKITDAGINLVTSTEYQTDPSNPVAKYLGAPPSSDPTSELVGYWEVKNFSIVDVNIAGGSHEPDGNPDLLIEKIPPRGLSQPWRYIWQDRNETTDMGAALELMTRAYKDWNDKFPDRLNWYPAGGAAGTSASPPPRNIAIPTPDAPQSRVPNRGAAVPLRVGGVIRPPTKTKQVNPERPASAVGSSGLILIEVTIGVDGKVQDAKVLRSVPGLDQAALAAVRQWEFEPTMVNGVRVPLIMTVAVKFAP